jgi:hypothetical protein
MTVPAGEAHVFEFRKPGVLRTTMLASFEDTGFYPHKLK